MEAGGIELAKWRFSGIFVLCNIAFSLVITRVFSIFIILYIITFRRVKGTQKGKIKGGKFVHYAATDN